MIRTTALVALYLSAVCGATVSPAREATAATMLPVYPGATFVPPPTNMPVETKCGHAIHVVSYDVRADEKIVAAWYGARVHGGRSIDTSEQEGPGNRVSTEIIMADGSQAAVISQIHFGGPRLSATATRLGVDKVDITLETIDPPLGKTYVDLMLRARQGDAAAKHDARAKLTALCPNP